MEIYKYKNPILSGFHPDPSICRVGDDFYLVNSTFEYFPGIPVYHSKDLINWEIIGHCLCDSEQVNLDGALPSNGLFAPSICYNNGYFFMTVTNITHDGNIIVHSHLAAGPWSEPVSVKQYGIDPSLFFDDDGKVYYISTGGDENGRSVIQISEIDPMTGEILSGPGVINRGCCGRSPEGPHLYKIGGYYYLMLAEGGTEYGHMETIQRSRSVYGPYEACPHNPIITNRNAEINEICACGHADLTDDANGNWWLVCLGIRCLRGSRTVMLHNLGRETFLAPVKWQDGWPVVGNNGRMEEEMEGPLPAAEGVCPSPYDKSFSDDFSKEERPLRYNFLRMPLLDNYKRQNGTLILRGTEKTIDDLASPTWVGIRQPEFNVEAVAVIDGVYFSREDAKAGITAYYSKDYHYDIFIAPSDDGQLKIKTARHIHDLYAVTNEVVITDSFKQNGRIYLRIKASSDYYQLMYSTDGREYRTLDTASTAGLCTEGTMYMTFTGTYLAMFAENGTAVFDSFEVKNNPE